MRACLSLTLACVLAACSEPRFMERVDGAYGDGEALRLESCTPSTAGSSAFDEDLDGRIDEGCTLSLGVPAPLLALHDGQHAPVGVFLSDDKRRLYVLIAPSGMLLMLEREGRGGAFGEARPVEGAALGGASAFALSRDEKELFMSDAAGALQRLTRTSRSRPFGAPEPVALTAAPPHRRPALSPDGLELFFASDIAGAAQIHRARRAQLGDPFEPSEPLSLGGLGESSPSLDETGLRLVFTRGGVLHSASRTSLSEPFELGAPIAVTLDVFAVDAPFVAIGSREVYFISAGRSWDPIPTGSLVRAELCLDGACVPRPADCPAGATPSPDGAHCYLVFATPLGRDLAASNCAERDMHLASLHSAGEHALVASLAMTEAWIDAVDLDEDRTCPDPTLDACGFGWSTGEPWLTPAWALGEPSGVGPLGEPELCVAIAIDGTIADRGCDTPLPFVCESDQWPSW